MRNFSLPAEIPNHTIVSWRWFWSKLFFLLLVVILTIFLQTGVIAIAKILKMLPVRPIATGWSFEAVSPKSFFAPPQIFEVQKIMSWTYHQNKNLTPHKIYFPSPNLKPLLRACYQAKRKSERNTHVVGLQCAAARSAAGQRDLDCLGDSEKRPCW